MNFPIILFYAKFPRVEAAAGWPRRLRRGATPGCRVGSARAAGNSLQTLRKQSECVFMIYSPTIYPLRKVFAQKLRPNGRGRCAVEGASVQPSRSARSVRALVAGHTSAYLSQLSTDPSPLYQPARIISIVLPA